MTKQLNRKRFVLLENDFQGSFDTLQKVQREALACANMNNESCFVAEIVEVVAFGKPQLVPFVPEESK